MKRVDMIVKAPHFYTMTGDGVGYQGNVCMVVHEGKIQGFVPDEDVERQYEAKEVLNLEHHAIFPGFIDAHMHSALNIMRGLAQDVNLWMMHGLQPFDRVLTQKERDAGSDLALIEAIKAGTTTLGDYNAKMEHVCQFIKKAGARGHLAQTVRSAKRRVYHPGELYEFDEEMGNQSIADNLALFDKWNNQANGRIKILFGPQGCDFLSIEQLMRVKELAVARHTKVHIHVQQGDRETWQIEKRYGKRPVALLSELGFLDENIIAVHLTDCNDDEARVVAKSKAGMVVNPGSIAIIDGVVCPSLVFQKAGGACALGSDQAPGNNCHNIINEMKNVTLFNKIKYGNPEVMPAYKALRMATIEGAKAIGLENDIGSLEPGKKADFIAVDLWTPSMQPVYANPMRNIVPNLVYSARGSEVTHSCVDGQLIMKDRKLVHIDEEAALAKVQAYPQGIGERATEEFLKINGKLAQYMKEDKL
ncbi:MAG: amidohydrolase family protein [Erysipelotrichaceae bacterium]|nr:amidohydrolase family protein [Erysipelotrichaceae bacterium]